MQSLALLVLSLVLSVSADGDCDAAFSACAAQVQAAMIADSNAGEKSNQVKMGVPISTRAIECSANSIFDIASRQQGTRKERRELCLTVPINTFHA